VSNIKAFVAHSFLDCDAEVIGKFLKYFEGLSKALPESFLGTRRGGRTEEFGGKGITHYRRQKMSL
jgi:hypothetical protein